MNLTIGDVENPAGSLALRRVSSKTGVVPINNITFGGSGANRIVTIAPVAKKSSDSATITVTVDDGQGGTATTTIKVTVGTTKNETINGHTFCRRWAAKRLRRWMQPYPERGTPTPQPQRVSAFLDG